VWDIESRSEIGSLKGHEGRVKSAAFSPNGRWIVSVSEDKTMRVWNAQSGTARAILKADVHPLRSSSFSADGRRLVTVSDDGRARVWDLENDKQISIVRGHTFYLRSAALSPDGRRIVTGCNMTSATYHGEARVCDAETGAEIAVLEGNKKPLHPHAFSPDGRWIVGGGVKLGRQEHTDMPRVWDARNGKTILILSFREVSSIVFSPDSRTIVTTSYGDTVVWDVQSRAEIACLKFPKPQWEFPRLCRGGSKSLTFQEVESTGPSLKL
jgi:WD40 repeat protein